MNKIFKIVLAVLVVGGFTSCATLSTASSEGNIKKKSVQFLLNKLEKNRIDYSWFGSKAKVKYEGSDKKIVFSALVRMQKDSLIWLKLKKMNVEGLRILITPQTIEILNRQESSYTKKPFSFLQQEFGIDWSFSDVQDLIIGNPVLYKQRKLLASTAANSYLIQSPNAQKEVLKIFLHASDYRMKEIRGSEKNNRIAIQYDTYETINEQNLPLQKNIQIDSERETILLQIEFSKVELNEVQKHSFKIPDSYRKD
jgi:hypothetical protein